jgi:ribonuclease D
MSPRRAFHPAPLPEVVVADPAALADCLAHLRTTARLAFDTEFVGEDSYRPDLCLVQVATPEAMYVIDPFGAGPLDGFWDLLLDPARTVVVHAGREEVRMCHFGAGKPPACLFDVQIAAALIGLPYPIGYAGLVQEVLGARAHKGETLTDWRRRPLTAAQLKYAFDDVRFLLPIHDRLAKRLDELGRTAWAAEEFAGFVTWATADDPSVEKWRKLKGAGGLRPRELAVVRAVFAWREGYAARLNRPPRVLLRDDLIVEIARRPPTTAEQVQGLRGVPRGEAEAIAAAVRSALALDPADHPTAFDRDNDPPHVAQLASLLAVVLADYGGKAELAPNFVASSADLKGLVRARQPGGKLPDDSPFRAGWRATAVRPTLEAVLDGTVGVRVADPAAAAPFTVDRLPPG